MSARSEDRVQVILRPAKSLVSQTIDEFMVAENSRSNGTNAMGDVLAGGLSDGSFMKPKTKERRRMEMKKICNEKARRVCFSKRRQGLFKKAAELVKLCGGEIAIVAFTPAGNAFTYSSSSVDGVLQRFVGFTNATMDQQGVAGSPPDGNSSSDGVAGSSSDGNPSSGGGEHNDTCIHAGQPTSASCFGGADDNAALHLACSVHMDGSNPSSSNPLSDQNPTSPDMGASANSSCWVVDQDTPATHEYSPVDQSATSSTTWFADLFNACELHDSSSNGYADSSAIWFDDDPAGTFRDYNYYIMNDDPLPPFLQI